MAAKGFSNPALEKALGPGNEKKVSVGKKAPVVPGVAVVASVVEETPQVQLSLIEVDGEQLSIERVPVADREGLIWNKCESGVVVLVAGGKKYKSSGGPFVPSAEFMG